MEMQEDEDWRREDGPCWLLEAGQRREMEGGEDDEEEEDWEEEEEEEASD
jgi:hypothetical protein